MRIVGCDLHASRQTIAMLDRDTGHVTERVVKHEGTEVRGFYAGLPPPILVGIEATGSMGWFVRLMDDLGITCQVGDPAKIRAVDTRRQKHDRRDARLLLTLLAEERFPAIWMPSAEVRDLRALLRHRDQWVRMRTRVRNALQGIALASGVRRGAGLWSQRGQAMLAALPLPLHTGHRRSELQGLHDHLTTHIEALDAQVRTHADARPQARQLMIQDGRPQPEAPAPVLRQRLIQPFDHRRIPGRPIDTRPIPGRPRQADSRTRARDRQSMCGSKVRDRVALLGRRYSFRSIRSFSARFSSARSA